MDLSASVVPLKKPRKIRTSVVIRDKKNRGLEHVNHRGRLIPEKVLGEDCRCARFKCFSVLSEQERQAVFTDFYKIPSKNLQDSHLCGLLKVDSIKQRRSRKPKGRKNLVQYSDSSDEEQPGSNDYDHAAFYRYKVRTKQSEVPVCKKAFLSLHGITPARLRRLQRSLCETLKSPIDRRGQHKNRPNALPEGIENLIKLHIRSFKPRQSHYSLRQNPNRYYLDERLNVRRMYKMFVDEYKIRVSYKVYWSIFFSKFNIKFGLPRTDTCSICDSLRQKQVAAENEDLQRSLAGERELHLRKAQAFYDLKKSWTGKAKNGEAMAICFDFMQNLPLPHIRDNLAFRCRQLWYYVFGIHNLADDKASMYVYTENIAKKGQNEVTSMLFHYFTRVVDITSPNLVIFSDGCPGQNKNYVMIHFLYIIVHCLKLFKSITYIFPMRGHSFLPNDQDFSIISKRKNVDTAEVPEHWHNIIRTCREKPSPFELHEMNQGHFYNIKQATDKFFLKKPKPAVQLKPLRMFRIQSCHSFLELRDTYSGMWRQSIIRNKTALSNELQLRPLFQGPIPLNPLKLKDLQTLSSVLSEPKHCTFYNSLVPGNDDGENQENADVDEEDNSSAYSDFD